MDGQCRLAVLVGGEILRLGGGNGFIAGHDALHQATHGLNTQREGNHVEQQQISRRVVARQLVGLNGGAKCNHLIRVEIGQGFLAKKFGCRALHLGHAGGAAHHDYPLHVIAHKLGIAHHASHSGHGPRGQPGGNRFKI
ncbi:MAG: hypothetical protein ACD_23C00749G0001 [uncultured bacterium]|nr:MAG: hypothetical protein ACD_23C00749G0001 [uncultured bacterium]